MPKQIASILLISKLSCHKNIDIDDGFLSGLKLSYRFKDNENIITNNRWIRCRIDCDHVAQLIYFLYCFDNYSVYRNNVRKNLESITKYSSFDENYFDLLIKCRVNDLNLISSIIIDIDWCRRIQYFAILRMELEESLSWLSTLGGAYSSLGDRNLRFAHEAETISWKQMKLSLIYGDPNLIARCLIYLSHSWCQQGRRREAIKLIRHYLYPFLIRLSLIHNCDRIVRRMYQALCFRIRYIYK